MAEEKKEMNEEKQEEKKETEEIEETDGLEKPEKKPRDQEKVGIAYIHSTDNNTIIHLTDMSGTTITQVSGGKVTKHARLKATPTVAMFAAKRVAEVAKEQGINSLYVRIKSKPGSISPGPGANAAIKSLSRAGLYLINILDTTAIPRGGPKKKGGKRGRRV